jgi:hypothetical protein
MKYTMQLISRDELKRKDQFKLVMALGGLGVPCEAHPWFATLSHAAGSAGLARTGR